MVVSVIRAFRWTPKYVMNELFVDEIDCLGLTFWYNDVVKQNEEIRSSTTTRK